MREERLNRIMTQLTAQGTVRVVELAKSLAVTNETIRRDLQALEEKHALLRVHGGAKLVKRNSTENTFLDRENKFLDQKRLIAHKAMRLVEENDFIALDVSTTNTQIALELADNFSELNVITNSLTIANLLAERTHFNIILPEGRLRNRELCVIGQRAIESIQHYHIDTFFMSISGLTLSEGYMDFGQQEFEVKQAFYEASALRYVVSDSSKFGATAMLKIGRLDCADGIITDEDYDPVYRTAIEELGLVWL